MPFQLMHGTGIFIERGQKEELQKESRVQVVLDMSQSFYGHNVTCLFLLTSYNLGTELLKES